MIPKSLHTVSSLVNLARHLAAQQGRAALPTDIRAAANILGYAGTADVHGLLEIAARKLAK